MFTVPFLPLSELAHGDGSLNPSNPTTVEQLNPSRSQHKDKLRALTLFFPNFVNGNHALHVLALTLIDHVQVCDFVFES